jgi:hypothetical protein
MSNEVPSCLIVCYQRSDQISGILSAYQEFGGKVVHFAIDGPKSSSEMANQKILLSKIYQTCEQLKLTPVVRHLGENIGLGQNVLSGLDWFFSTNPSGVIIEDDLICEADLFEWFSFALREFQNYPDVMMISGNRFSPESTTNEITATNYPLIWGWATTSMKWKEMRSWFDEDFYPSAPIPLKVKNFWKTSLLKVKLGEVNSWAIPLAYNFRFRSKLCVIPPKNLVANRGADCYATHTIAEESLYGLKIKRLSNMNSLVSSQITQEQILFQNEYIERYIYKISKLHIIGHFGKFRLMKAKLKSLLNNNV